MHSWTRRAAATAGALGIAALAAAVPAGASSNSSTGSVSNPYSPAYGHTYRHGAVPTQAQDKKMKAYTASHTSNQTTGPDTLSYGGGIGGIGVTSSTPRIYLVFWGRQWGTQGTDGSGNMTFSNDSAGAAPYLQNLFKGLGTNGEKWSGTMTQYCDGTGVAYGATSCPSGSAHVGYPTGALLGGALAGVWYDSSPEPQTATGHDIGQQAVNAAAHFGNTTTGSSRYAQYDILSASGLNPDGWQTAGFCAWHDYTGDSTLSGGAITSPTGPIAFTNMPYVLDAAGSCGENFVNSGSAGILDGFGIVNGHEYAETVTDQNPGGGWFNFRTGAENGDECAWISSGQGAATNVTTNTGNFAMQSTWSNDTNRCDISHSIVGGGGTGSNDFSISDSPGSATVAPGGGTSTTVSTSVTSGTGQTVTLTASGFPSSAKGVFTPSSVTAGGPSSVLNITTTTSTPAGTYTITITGTEGSAIHATTFKLTVSTRHHH